MALSISDAYRPKRVSKKAHRRATVDTPCLARPKQKLVRRFSLPLKSVQFSEMSEVFVFEPSTVKRWYTCEDHQRMKRERVSDVVSFRVQARQKKSARPESAGACCPVGLEQLLSTKAMYEAHSNRKIVIHSVLQEQNLQRSFGYQNPDKIALLSYKLSAQAFAGAQKRGKFQEMAKFIE